MVARVIKIPDRHYVRFFDETVECSECYQQTYGRVYEGTGAIVCHICFDVMLELEPNPRYDDIAILFTPEFLNGEDE